MCGQEGRRRQAVKRRLDGDQQDVAVVPLQCRECGQPLRDQVVVWRERVVGQGFPVRQLANTALGQQPLQFIIEALPLQRIGREYYDQRRCLGRPCHQLGDQQTLGAGRDRWHDVTLADIRQPLGDDPGG